MVEKEEGEGAGEEAKEEAEGEPVIEDTGITT